MQNLSVIKQNLLPAFYRIEVKIIGRSKHPKSLLSENRSPLAFAAYRAGELLRDEKLKMTFDFRPRFGIFYTEIMAPENAPEWVYERPKLWNAIQLVETYKNAQLAREVLISLPKVLTLEQCKELVRDFVQQHFVTEGMIADIAIHKPNKNIENQNIHAHIMLSTRTIDPDGFGKKNRIWNSRAKLYGWRKSWCEMTNLYFEREGLDYRVEHRSRAAIETEHGQYFDYSVQDLTLEDIESQPIVLNEAIEIDTATKTEIETHQEAIDPLEANIGEIINIAMEHTEETNSHAPAPQQNQQAYELLHKLKNNEFVTIEECKGELQHLSTNIKQRLLELEAQLNELSDSRLKEQLRLQIRIESSEFNQVSNHIQADILRVMDAKKYTGDISACDHRARVAGRDHKKHISEWNSRAVRDIQYAPTDSNFSILIAKTRARESRKWSEFEARAKASEWDSSRIIEESRYIRAKLDYELARAFGLGTTLSLGR